MNDPKQPTIDEALAAEPQDTPEVQAEPKPEAADPTPIYTEVAQAAEVESQNAPVETDETPAADPDLVHEYQVTHKVSHVSNHRSWSQHTSAFMAAEEAIKFVREHVL